MPSLLQNGEKKTPKQWKAEIQSLQAEYDSIGREQTKGQQNRQQNKTKRKEEELR